MKPLSLGLLMVMVLWVLCPTKSAHAQGVPVFDGQSLIQEILQAERALLELEQLAKQYEKQIEELSVAVEQRDALLGSRGLGRLLNGGAEQAARRELPATLDELLRLSESGDIPSLRELAQLLERREQELELATAADVGRRGLEDGTSQAYDRARRATLANLAVSEKAYGDATRRIGSYERLIGAIDETPDLKASTDLQSRIAAENGLTLNELVRLQSLAISASASQEANGLVGRSQMSEFSRFDEEKFRALGQSLEIRAARGSDVAR